MRSSSRALVQTSSPGKVVVGLIDTGCDTTNKNLNVVGGMDFTSDENFGLDGNGHGTHVAGELGLTASMAADSRVTRLSAAAGTGFQQLEWECMVLQPTSPAAALHKLLLLLLPQQ